MKHSTQQDDPSNGYEDALGDQFLLRDGDVHRLNTQDAYVS